MENYNIDQIITDWFFKSEKGYCEFPYSNRDLEILREVVIENKVDSSEIDKVIYHLTNKSVITEDVATDILGYLAADKTISGYKPVEVYVSPQNDKLYNIKFDGINFRDRKSRIDIMKNLKPIRGFQPEYVPKKIKGSSIGYVSLTKGNKTFYVTAKGSSSSVVTSTDIKEGLVILFYNTSIRKPVDEDNFYDYSSKLLYAIDSPKSQYLTEKAKEDLLNFLDKSDSDSGTIDVLNQCLSQALAIKSAYPKDILIRTGIFDDYRKLASGKLSIPADKWCPGDIYVLLDKSKASRIFKSSLDQEPGPFIESINDAFNEEWGSRESPLTAVSLKFEKAQGGKAKAYFEKYSSLKTEYNLTSEEISYKELKYKKGIQEFRDSISKRVRGNKNVIYNITNPDLKSVKEIEKLRGKYAALKAINFFFSQLKVRELDDGLLALASFAMSLSDTSPAFFKVVGDRSGRPGQVEEYPRGSSLSLLLDDMGKPEPIEITDSPTMGGLSIIIKAQKGGDPIKIKLEARNNGMTQGTIEITQIKKL